MEPDKGMIALSSELLLNVKLGNITNDVEQALALFSLTRLALELDTDEAKKTCWINIYNAFFQLLSTRDKKHKPQIFKDKLIVIAGKKFSLDDIEHGILRRYRCKYSLGYLPRIFPSKLIRQLAVAAIDYRIHFALNCGAKSCPPIAFYQVDKIDKQLDLATQSFLESETTIDHERKIVNISILMRWFRADFGGKPGIYKILAKYLKKDLQGYAIKYSRYDWDTALQNFAE